MKKKAIRDVPYLWSEPQDGYTYTARAFRKEIQGTDHLFVEVYKEQPVIRIILTDSDFGNYHPDTETWSRETLAPAAMGTPIWNEDLYRRAPREREYTYMPEEDQKLVVSWCGHTGTDWQHAIYFKEKGIKQDRSMKRYERRQQRLKERVNDTPELPEDLKQWADRRLFRQAHYLYYKKSGRYADIACSACGNVSTAAFKRTDTFEGMFETVIEPPKAGEHGTCPYCGERGIWKPKGRTKGAWAMTDACYIGQPFRNGGAVIRYVEMEKVFRLEEYAGLSGTVMVGAGENMIINEVSRLYIEPGRKPQQDFHKHSPFTGNFWDDCQLDGMANIRLQEGKVYYKTWDLLKGTCLQYSGAEWYEKDYPEMNLIRYMERYNQYPQLEIISKIGLKEIAHEMVGYRMGIVADPDGRTPEAFLGINKGRLSMLRKEKGDPRLLKALQREHRQQAAWTPEILRMMAEIDSSGYATALQYMSAGKLVNVLEKYSGVDLHAEEPLCQKAREMLNVKAQLYFDYLDMRVQRGYDLANTVFLFPRDLKREHDRMVLEIDNEKQDKRQQEVEERFPQIRRAYRSLCSIYSAQTEGYIIRPARSAGEIVKEGRLLHHCVGGDTYLRKHAEGKSYILFIRHVEDPDMPYITVEIKGTDIIQWYGAYDRKPDKEIIADFLDDYRKALRERQALKTAI